MSRPLRLEFAGALYHITTRGNAINLIFLQEDDFALHYSQISRTPFIRFGWKIGVGGLLAMPFNIYRKYKNDENRGRYFHQKHIYID
jgi:hypothetical protein